MVASEYIFKPEAGEGEITYTTLENGYGELERIYVHGRNLEFCAIDHDQDSTLTNINDISECNWAGGLGTVCNDHAFYYYTDAAGNVVALGHRDDDQKILEYYRNRVFGEVVVLPIVDDGVAGGSTADDGIEDTPDDLSDNNSLMMTNRGLNGDYVGWVSEYGNAQVSAESQFNDATGRKLCWAATGGSVVSFSGDGSWGTLPRRPKELKREDIVPPWEEDPSSHRYKRWKEMWDEWERRVQEFEEARAKAVPPNAPAGQLNDPESNSPHYRGEQSPTCQVHYLGQGTGPWWQIPELVIPEGGFKSVEEEAAANKERQRKQSEQAARNDRSHLCGNPYHSTFEVTYDSKSGKIHYRSTCVRCQGRCGQVAAEAKKPGLIYTDTCTLYNVFSGTSNNFPVCDCAFDWNKYSDSVIVYVYTWDGGRENVETLRR